MLTRLITGQAAKETLDFHSDNLLHFLQYHGGIDAAQYTDISSEAICHLLFHK